MDFYIHHIAISVTDIEKSEKFYSHFGFRKIIEYQSEDEGLRIRHLKKGNLIIELFQFQNHISSKKYSLWEDLKVLGYKHIAFKVEDIYRAKEELIREGLISPNTEIKKGRTGILYFFLTDPDGNFVEIVEDKRKF